MARMLFFPVPYRVFIFMTLMKVPLGMEIEREKNLHVAVVSVGKNFSDCQH